MNNSKRLAADGLLTAVLFVLQVALSYLPNIELVSLSVILYTLVLGKRVIHILLAFSLM
jgi:energy-coupling factor transport system substrate-specific component